MSATFWKDKQVLVTGHTGFKGGWLVCLLSSLGAKVHGIALPAAEPLSLYHQITLSDFLTTETIADIRDSEVLHQCLKMIQPDIILHLAAQPLVRHSYLDAKGTYETNVLGTLYLLEALRHHPARSTVIVTSDKCYENKNIPWGYREGDSLGGRDPYSNSKACAELIVQAYHASFFAFEEHIGIATARAGNVIGGGDWAEDRLVPDLVRALDAGGPIILRNPDATRPWQHVLDPLCGYLILAEKLYVDPKSYAKPWNFGPLPYAHRTVLSVTEQFLTTWFGGDFPAGSIQIVPSHLPEAQMLALDSTLARQQLGWETQFTFEVAMQVTADWYRAWYDQTALRTKTLSQIELYLREYYDNNTCSLRTLCSQ